MPNTYKAAVRFRNGDKGLYDVTADSLAHARDVVLRELEEANAVMILCNENDKGDENV